MDLFDKYTGVEGRHDQLLEIGAEPFGLEMEEMLSATEAMIGGQGEAIASFEQMHDQLYHGDVRAFGEIWQARSQRPIAEGDKVNVDAVDGLVLEVSEET